MNKGVEPPQYTLEKLATHHDIWSFDCQHSYLNAFLFYHALRETLHDLSLTFVLCDNSHSPAKVAGYFTLRSDSYYPEDHSEVDLIPVVELVALARDKDYSRQGIGDYLLIEALKNVYNASKLVGITGIHLAPSQEGTRLYKRYNFGTHPLSYRRDLLFLPSNTIRQIVQPLLAEETDLE